MIMNLAMSRNHDEKNISLEDSIIYACGSNDMINNDSIMQG